MKVIAIFKRALVSSALLLVCQSVLADPPQAFSVNYDARYRGMRAEATISLTQQTDGTYLAQSQIAIKLLGATVTSIHESSRFDWLDENPRPHHYEYVQSGLGRRQRSIDFDWEQGLAKAQVNDTVTDIPLSRPAVDEMSMYTLIKQAIQSGEEDIYFDVIDRNQLEEYHYRLVGEDIVESPIGAFNALKVERVRENSERQTELWFAPDYDMLLIKIFHRDPDGDEYEITIDNAQLNGQPVIVD